MKGIGPALPLFRDEKFGNFSLIDNYADEVKQNFKHLILTAPGERMMLPDFGVGMRHFLFEPMSQSIPKIRQRINGQVSKYMPFVKINAVRFNHELPPEAAEESNILSVLIEYEVPSINLHASLSVA